MGRSLPLWDQRCPEQSPTAGPADGDTPGAGPFLWRAGDPLFTSWGLRDTLPASAPQARPSARSSLLASRPVSLLAALPAAGRGSRATRGHKGHAPGMWLSVPRGACATRSWRHGELVPWAAGALGSLHRCPGARSCGVASCTRNVDADDATGTGGSEGLSLAGGHLPGTVGSWRPALASRCQEEAG